MMLAALLACLLLLVRNTNQDTLPDGIDCPKYEIEETGTFNSPEYNIRDDGAIVGFHCWYNIRAPGKNKVIVLEFLDFELHDPMYTEKLNYDKYEAGCEKEFVEVYRDSEKPEKERYCGTELYKRTIHSTSHTMKFVFNKYYKQSKGFRIKLRFVKKTKEIDPCLEMYGAETSIAVENAAEHCRLSVKAPVGKAAKLTLTEVAIATENHVCKNAKAEENGECNRRVVGCCGAGVVKKGHRGDSNVLDVGVAATSSFKGKVSFISLPPTCGGHVTMKAGSEHSIKLPKRIETPVHNELSCVWTITIPDDAKGLKIKYDTFDFAPKSNNACGTDQFSVVEFKESDIVKFLERRAKESYSPVCGSDLAGKTQEFTSGKTVYLFLSMDFKNDHIRQFEAELNLL